MACFKKDLHKFRAMHVAEGQTSKASEAPGQRSPAVAADASRAREAAFAPTAPEVKFLGFFGCFLGLMYSGSSQATLHFCILM